MMTLVEKILCVQDENKPSLSTFSGDYSVKDIISLMNHYRSILADRNIKGKKVGLLVPAIDDYLALVLVVNELGGTVIPLSWQFRKDDLISVLDFLDPHMVFSINAHSGFSFSEIMTRWASSKGKETYLYLSDDCKNWELDIFNGDQRQLEDDGTDFICCSSGSTGIPKGLVFNLNAFDPSYRLLTDFMELKSEDNVLFYASTSTIFGIKSMTNIIRSGASAIVPTAFDIRAIVNLMERTSCNKIVTTPSVFKAIYTFARQLNPHVLKKIELVCLTGESMSEDFMHQFDLLSHCKFSAQYGISETGAAMSCDLREGLNYTVYNEIQYKIKEGELFLKTQSSFSGYYKNPQLTEETFDSDGWYMTGDLVEFADNGKIRIVGRKKNMIKKGGQQVIPGEVEMILSQHEKVKQTVVMGVPHPVFGEQVVAFIVLMEAATERDLQSFCSGKLANYKIPDNIVIVNELPLAQGKTDKLTLRKMFEKIK